MNEKVCVVIVTFNNADMLSSLLHDLFSQSHLPDEIIVVDNASRDHTESMIKLDYPKVNYIKLKGNLGSAGGYHEGIRLASQSSDFMYTLDDDVSLNPDTLAQIIKGFYLLEKSMPSRVGAVRSVGERHPSVVPTKLDIFPWRGTLLKSSIIREVGLPSQDYFLYGEDLEYSLRLTKKGYLFYWIPTSICRERGRDREGKTHTDIFGIKSVRYREPFRLYYAFRNEIIIYRHYHRVLNLFHTIIYAMKVMVMILASEGWTGHEAISAIVKGMADGIGGRLGKNVHYTPI